MNLSRIVTVSLLATLTSHAKAQFWTGTPTVTTGTANYTLANYGNSNFGGSLDARAVRTKTTLGGVTKHETTTGLYAVTRNNSQSTTAASITATGESSNGFIVSAFGTHMSYLYGGNVIVVGNTPPPQPCKTTVVVRVGNNTIWSPPPVSGVSFTKQWQTSIGSQQISSATVRYTVGIIPVNLVVRGSAGAGCNYTCNLNTVNAALSFGGGASCWANGSALAEVGWSWASAGVTATLQNGSAQANLSVQAGMFSGVSGVFTFTMTPMRLFVDLFGQLFGNYSTLRLIDVSTSAVNYVRSF